jgi:hypothetical protein
MGNGAPTEQIILSKFVNPHPHASKFWSCDNRAPSMSVSQDNHTPASAAWVAAPVHVLTNMPSNRTSQLLPITGSAAFFMFFDDVVALSQDSYEFQIGYCIYQLI